MLVYATISISTLTLFSSFFISFCTLPCFYSSLHVNLSVARLLPGVLHNGEKNNGERWEGSQLAEDQPDVDHLDVRGGGQDPLPPILLMKMAVVTSMVVKFTLNAASKVVIISVRIFLLNLIVS